jgi:hypothetical protein
MEVKGEQVSAKDADEAMGGTGHLLKGNRLISLITDSSSWRGAAECGYRDALSGCGESPREFGREIQRAAITGCFDFDLT